MRSKIISFALLMTFGFVAFAQEAAPVAASIPPAGDVRLRIDDARNYLQLEAQGGGGSTNDGYEGQDDENFGSGGVLSYYYRLNDRILLGVGLSVFDTEVGDATERDCHGDLATAQCIAFFGNSHSESIEFKTLIYFRDQGYKKWGFYVSPGLGFTKNTTEGRFYRYDQDPGFFCGLFGGDCKRLQETGEMQENTTTSVSAKIAGGYQFVWTPNQAIAGHILDLGLAGIHTGSRNSVAVTDSNGVVRNLSSEQTFFVGTISYSIVF